MNLKVSSQSWVLENFSLVTHIQMYENEHNTSPM